MGTKIRSTQDYIGYIKCGEILKSPLKNYQNQFIFKCFVCGEIHFLLEPLVIHLQEHFKDDLTARERVDETNVKLEKVSKEICASEILEIKLEENDQEMEDPLIDSKIGTYDILSVKDELAEQEALNKHLEDCRKNFEEHSVEFSSGYTDSEDETIIKTTAKRISKFSPLVDKFMKSKTNVRTLVELYKNQPDLWNKDSPYYRFKDKKPQFYQEITNNLNNKINLNLTLDEVVEIIGHICRTHNENYKRLQDHEGKDKNRKLYKRSWYFEDLYFLRPNEIIQLEKLDSQLPDLLPEQIIKIFKIYQEFFHLWNTNLIEYTCSNKREDAYNGMLNMLALKMDLTITKNILKEYIRTIHNYFSREKRRRSNITYYKRKPIKFGDTQKKDVSKTKANNALDYYEHLNFLCDHEGPFLCSKCNRLYSKPLNFQVHKSQHDGSMPLKCSQCNKEFKTVASYTTHAKRHFEDLEFVCKECDKKYLNLKDLKTHMLSHTGDQPFCCETCGAKYRHSFTLKTHQKCHEKLFSHICSICSKGYYSKNRYDDHMNSHMNIRSYICKVCNKGFITKRALKSHSVMHSDVRNYACNLCTKAFKLKIYLVQHMRTHGNY